MIAIPPLTTATATARDMGAPPIDRELLLLVVGAVPFQNPQEEQEGGAPPATTGEGGPGDPGAGPPGGR